MTLPILMITGPTGLGKTELAVGLARRFPVEIISADSMQVYRGMEIGTAQPTAEEQSAARFHLCGVLDPGEPFDVQRFLALADAAHRDILARGRWPLYVGGTGLYLRALRWGLFEEGSHDGAVRAALEDEARVGGLTPLHERLARLDPAAAARIAPTDPVRIIRALEVYAVTGQPMSQLQRQWAEPQARFAHELVVLDAPREWLRERIARRTDAMLAAGWIDEVAALLDRGLDETRHCFKALGYREIIRHLRGELNREDLRRLIVTHTHQFAKRQMVWFRREQPAHWMQTDTAGPRGVAHELENLLEKLQSGLV